MLCVLRPAGGLAMEQKASLQNPSCQYVHRAGLDLPKAMLEVKELRKKVRLAETAATKANRRATNEPTPRSKLATKSVVGRCQVALHLLAEKA